MSFLTENWFFLGVALACIGMHLFGHGHGHGHGHGQGHGQGHGRNSHPEDDHEGHGPGAGHEGSGASGKWGEP